MKVGFFYSWNINRYDSHKKRFFSILNHTHTNEPVFFFKLNRLIIIM